MNKITTISSKTHPIIQHLIRLKSEKKYRYEQKMVLLEGVNCISDLLKNNEAERLIALSGTVPKNLLYKELIYVTEDILKKISGLHTPQPIIAEIKLPQESNLENKKRILAFDNIQDPGNLGTLLRSALALGFDGAFFLNLSCDPFNDKALRAAKGATFIMPFRHGSWDELKVLIDKNKLEVLVASAKGDPITDLLIPDNVLLILGNESQGAKAPSDLKAHKISIPMQSNVESLNVASAGAILMYAITQKKVKKNGL